jgi:misacylated tRNA(Ala) deacylase
MTEALYFVDSTVQRFEATVERVLDDRVVLSRTHFYPEGGGQPADHGRLEADGETWEVTDVQKKDTIYHHLACEPPAVGTAVTGVLDWDRRFVHMRYHTAQHLLSALLLDVYDAPTVGNQLYHDRARIDVEHDRFTDEDLHDIETRMNEFIAAGFNVEWYTMDRERAEDELDRARTRIDLLPKSITELRIVEIRESETDDVYDRTACAGTHVENTTELGSCTMTGRETAGSGRERLSFVLE